MPGPFYNAIKGTTAGTPGTGAFTPNAASSGFLAWSTVPTGWIGLVRYEDGSAWELQYSYWNGTTLSRAASTQFVSGSTGSALTLSSSATAAMIADANEIGVDFSNMPVRGWLAAFNSTTVTNLGTATPTSTGTPAAAALATTNYLTRQGRIAIASATTANAQAGWSTGTIRWATTSSTAGLGGWLFSCRFGVSTIPTGPRLFLGMTNGTIVGDVGEPSALAGTAYAVLGKDSGDTNMQLLVNDAVNSTGTKTDTGIALVANGWYEVTIWQEPGSLTVYMLLVRLDTGAIFYGSTATDVPPTNSTLLVNAIFALSSTTGTAITPNLSHALVRNVA